MSVPVSGPLPTPRHFESHHMLSRSASSSFISIVLFQSLRCLLGFHIRLTLWPIATESCAVNCLISEGPVLQLEGSENRKQGCRPRAGPGVSRLAVLTLDPWLWTVTEDAGPGSWGRWLTKGPWGLVRGTWRVQHQAACHWGPQPLRTNTWATHRIYQWLFSSLLSPGCKP